jgi:hypothetical protein
MSTKRKKNTVSNKILWFYHCKQCLEEVQFLEDSPREYVHMEIGPTKEGIQIWCVRHESNVMNIDFQGAGPFPALIDR